ncbi:unnamed protein product [Caretta caretta]
MLLLSPLCFPTVLFHYCADAGEMEEVQRPADSFVEYLLFGVEKCHKFRPGSWNMLSSRISLGSAFNSH